MFLLATSQVRFKFTAIAKVIPSIRQPRVRSVTTLSPAKVTQILAANEVHLDDRTLLPNYVKAIQCNQLDSNSPIEDRLRVSSVQIPGCAEPSLILGVFDGHGGSTTADIVSRRLFSYIALMLHPDPSQLKVSNPNSLNNLITDLHFKPRPIEHPRLRSLELEMITKYQNELIEDGRHNGRSNIVKDLKNSFRRCDDDLSNEVQEYLTKPSMFDHQVLRHYLTAAISGCCAIVMVMHQGFAYMASSGDCRAILGTYERNKETQVSSFKALELNDEHNCDNINEVRRLTASHPKSEQNTMIKHNRLLGHLMPFRAFGDFNYKWDADTINACGITRVFGSGVIPSNYETPPYLIVEPDIKVIQVDRNTTPAHDAQHASVCVDEAHDSFFVMATDGLWELFESSRDVVETIVDHSVNASQEDKQGEYDSNCATHMLRSALRFGPYQDNGQDPERLKQLYHIRLESTLTLPKAIVRNFRDDISIILVKL